MHGLVSEKHGQHVSSALNLIWFVILDRWSRRPHKNGEIFFGYLVLFFIYRFIYEQFRKKKV